VEILCKDGIPSIVNKWDKANMTLKNGFDLVIELPTIYSISSSENFAYGSVGILNSLGIIDYLSFGSEHSDINTLKEISTILLNEPPKYKALLNNELKKGLSFPVARQIALENYTKNPELSNIISKPNNILAIEYLKALAKLNSSINPFCIKRVFTEHNSNISNGNFASATLIRNLLTESNIDELNHFIPTSTYDILKACYNNGTIVNGLKCFEKEIMFTLRSMSIEELANLPDVNEGLEFVIKKAADSTNNLEALISSIKSKRYTYTRIQRILLYALLRITKNDMELSKNINNSYIRILAATEKGKELLSKISKITTLPIITSIKNAPSLNEASSKRLLNIDINSTNIYTLAYKNESISNLDFTHPIFYSH